MHTSPTLKTIVQVIEGLPLAKRRKAAQGRKPIYSDSFIVALAVYQKLYKIKHAQAMLAILASFDVDVPAASTFCERKQQLLGQIILVVKHLCANRQAQAIKQHLDSKKVEVIDFARANRTKRAGAYGYDHIHKSTFFGFRLHARVDEQGAFCAVLLRPANEHDVTVAPRLLEQLSYRIITADKGYISQDLKRALDKHAVHLVTPRRSNQLPPPPAERRLYKNHRRVETAFSSLDRLGLSDRPYRSTIGFVLHVYLTILAYQLQDVFKVLMAHCPFVMHKLHFHLLCMTVLQIGVSTSGVHQHTSAKRAFQNVHSPQNAHSL